MPPDDTAEQLEREFQAHRLDYERRHADLEQRMMRLETIVGNLVTQKDLADFKATVTVLQESVKDFKALSAALPTREEVKWQRWLMLFILAMVGAHVLGIPIPGIP